MTISGKRERYKDFIYNNNMCSLLCVLMFNYSQRVLNLFGFKSFDYKCTCKCFSRITLNQISAFLLCDIFQQKSQKLKKRLIDWCLAPTVAVFQLRNHGGRRCLLSTERYKRKYIYVKSNWQNLEKIKNFSMIYT